MKAPPKRPPTASQVAHWITFKEEQRLEWQKKYLIQLCEADQEIREANELILEFTTMLRERKGERFDAWLEKVEQQGISELRNFALSLKKDYEAVKAIGSSGRTCAPEGIHARICWLMEHPQYIMVLDFSPRDFSLMWPTTDLPWKKEVLLMKVAHGRTG